MLKQLIFTPLGEDYIILLRKETDESVWNYVMMIHPKSTVNYSIIKVDNDFKVNLEALGWRL